jgi:hypothetical protein
MDGEVVLEKKPVLGDKQISRLLRMNEVLRDLAVLQTVSLIKESISVKKIFIMPPSYGVSCQNMSRQLCGLLPNMAAY